MQIDNTFAETSSLNRKTSDDPIEILENDIETVTNDQDDENVYEIDRTRKYTPNICQTRALEFALKYEQEIELTLAIMTGIGKSFIIRDLIQDFMNKENEDAVLVMSRLNVVLQHYRKYFRDDHEGFEIVFYCSENERDNDNDDYHEIQLEANNLRDSFSRKKKLILTTYHSLPKLMESSESNNLKLTIFDESHNCGREKIRETLQNEEKKRQLGKIYHFSATIDELVNLGPQFKFGFSDGIQHKLIRDFEIYCMTIPDEKNGNHYHHLLHQITTITTKLTKHRSPQYLSFCQYAAKNIENSVLDMVEKLKDITDTTNTYWIEGITQEDRNKKKRQEKFIQFQQTERELLLKLLVSCRSLSEGTDLQNVDGIIFFDPRQSFREIIQIIGRSIRLFRDEDGNPLPWDEQTPARILLPIYLNTNEIQELNNITEQSDYLKNEISEYKDGVFASVINVLAALKDYDPIFDFKFHVEPSSSLNGDSRKKKNDNDNPNQMGRQHNQIQKHTIPVIFPIDETHQTQIRLSPKRLEEGLLQLEMGLRDGSVNGFFRKEEFFRNIQDVKEKMKLYSEDINHVTESWIRQTILGQELRNWLNNQLSIVNNPETGHNSKRFVNQHPQLRDAIKEIPTYEHECQINLFFSGISHIKMTMKLCSEDINHVTERWIRQTILGQELRNWLNNQLSIVNNPETGHNSKRFVNQHPQLRDAIKEIPTYEHECQINLFFSGISHIKMTMKLYSEDINHVTEKWSRQTILGQELRNWLENQLSIVKNLETGHNSKLFVNKHPQLRDAIKKIVIYEYECKKNFQNLKKEHKQKVKIEEKEKIENEEIGDEILSMSSSNESDELSRKNYPDDEDEYTNKKKRKHEFSKEQKTTIIQRQDNKCNNFPGSDFQTTYEYQCLLYQNGKDGTFEKKVGYEIDHIIPIFKRGRNDIDNGQALCPCCHNVKTKQEKSTTLSS